MKTWTAAVLLAAAATGLTACGGDDEGSDAGGGTTIEGPTLSATNPRTADPAGAGARNELVDGRCEQKDGSWSLTGVLKNSGPTDAIYTVGAYVASTADGNVVGKKVEEFPVGAGQEARVDLADFHRSTEDGMACTISVNRR